LIAEFSTTVHNMRLQTLKLHWKLLVAPVVVGAVVAAWFTFGAASSYRSAASLWVENGVSVSSSLVSGEDTGAVGPASLESGVISELLATGGFDQAIAKDSGLASFYAQGRSAGGFSPSALLAHRHQQEAPLAQAVASVALNTQITVKGPQVLEVSYEGPSPTVARDVVRSLLSELGKAASRFGPSIGQAASSYYRKRLASAMQVADNTRNALRSFEQSNGSGAIGSPTYTSLVAEEQTAAAQLAAVKLNSSQAAVEAESNDGANNATISVIDGPSLPRSPTSGMFRRVLGLFAGGFAGLVLSIAALMLLRAPSATRDWDAEMPTFERLAWADGRSAARQAAESRPADPRPGAPRPVRALQPPPTSTLPGGSA
jgi:hypothetical protein